MADAFRYVSTEADTRLAQLEEQFAVLQGERWFEGTVRILERMAGTDHRERSKRLVIGGVQGFRRNLSLAGPSKPSIDRRVEGAH